MSKINSLLKKTELFEKLALYGDRKSFLESFAQQSVDAPIGPSLDGGYSGELDSAPKMTPNPDAKFGPPSSLAPAPQVATIPASVQKKLNDLLVPAGKIVPVNVDGKLTQETRRALNAFRKAYNVPASATDQQVFSQIMTAHKLETDYNNRPQSNMEAIPSTDSIFDTLKQPGPTVASSLYDKANMFQKLSRKYEK
jgi:peptidoglycan hydrolase-like protein with peptidoglycan-binding domain